MKNILKLALLPCVAALTIAAAPASAVSVSSNAPIASSLTSGTSTTLSKQEVKQQRKKAKQCAKLAKKMNKSSLSAGQRDSYKSSWTAMCKPASAVTTEQTAKPSSAPASDSPGSNASSGNTSSGNTSSGNTGSSNSVPAPSAAAAPLYVPTPSIEKSGDSSPAPQVTEPGAVVAAVPEPGSLALLGLGLMGLGFARRRTK